MIEFKGKTDAALMAAAVLLEGYHGLTMNPGSRQAIGLAQAILQTEAKRQKLSEVRHVHG